MIRGFLFGTLLLGVSLVAAATAAGEVVINEFIADPARDWSPSDGDLLYDAQDDEWVEIMNAGAAPVDITGWRLRDAVSDSSWRYGFSGVLGPGEFVVVYGNESYAWEDANGFARQGLSLNNSGDTITLVKADLGTVADQITYSSTEVLDDRAVGRIPDGTGGWEVFDGLNPMSPPATGLMPTPGVPNSGSPVEPADWGRIKSLYR